MMVQMVRATQKATGHMRVDIQNQQCISKKIPAKKLKGKATKENKQEAPEIVHEIFRKRSRTLKYGYSRPSIDGREETETSKNKKEKMIISRKVMTGIKKCGSTE